MTSQIHVAGGPTANDLAMAKATIRHELLARQNVILAIVGGLIGAIIGAALWAVVTVVTHFQIGFMAVGVGWLVGQLTWGLGRGLNPMYGVIGAILALLGCMAGNLLSACYSLSRIPEMEASFLQILGGLNADWIEIIMKETFHPIDIVFYCIAIYEGWRFSFRKLLI